ncbi:MAG: hypothetical protein ACLTE8_05500 [Christensenellales bacterium]
MGRIVGLEILDKVKSNKKKPTKDEAAAGTLEEDKAEPEKDDAKKSEK